MNVNLKEYLPTPANVWERLRRFGPMRLEFKEIMRLYYQERALFFDLACVGLPALVPAWAEYAARVTMQLRLRMSDYGRCLKPHRGSFLIISSNSEPVFAGGVNEIDLRDFLAELHGATVVRDPENSDYKRAKAVGAEITASEMLFQLGDPDTWEAEAERLRQFQNTT